MFGFTVGRMRMPTASQQPGDPMLVARIVMEGSAESVNNLAAASMFSTFSCVLVAVGQRRHPLPNPSAVAR